MQISCQAKHGKLARNLHRGFGTVCAVQEMGHCRNAGSMPKFEKVSHRDRNRTGRGDSSTVKHGRKHGENTRPKHGFRVGK